MILGTRTPQPKSGPPDVPFDGYLVSRENLVLRLR